MPGDPDAAAAGAHPASTGKGPRSSTRHRQFRDRAKTRVDDLQDMFSGLQSARKESRSADAAVLEEQVHQMLREWRAELSVPSPASSLQGNNREFSDPPSETLRLLQLAMAEEDDDATSKLAVPRSPLPMLASHQSHEHGQNGRMPDPDQQCEAVAGGAQGDCGEVAAVANAMFNDQMYYIDHELSIDDFPRDDDYKMSFPDSNQDHFNKLHGIVQLEHQQFNFPLDLPPPNSYVDANNSVQDTGDVFVHMSDLLATMRPSPSQYLGPKCALWDCGRPVGGSEERQDYCNPYHAGLALNDDGLLGTRPVMRPRGIDLKDGPLFTALIAKVQGKNVGIPVCEGAATSKSPWNAPELFDLSLLEGESLREWLFFDTSRRAFESGNRKQRSLPDYSGRGWHESRKQVMKDFGGLKRSYYMDPQPSSNYEWHLFEYEINDSDALALYRLELKSSDPKKSAKSKLASTSLNEIQQQMVMLTADSPVENKRTARSIPKANQKGSNAKVYPHVNTPSQVTAPNAYQAVPRADQITFLNENVVYGPHLPHSENVIYGPHLPHGYSAEGSSFYWHPSDGT
ncbi:transcription factor VOZ1-like [Phragmites australis]|uniref:transcription factor VOZ1-like n=1 Tax=Phragmites australis TaxID=29695 RepID=UPI002D79D8D7|nr:transcription factor VOZ1-like [Phragmites australis]